MKVFKNKKQRFIAVFLSLVFAFMLVPFMDAYASNRQTFIKGYHDINSEEDDKEYNVFTDGDSTVYCFRLSYSENPTVYAFILASSSPFKQLNGGEVWADCGYIYSKNNSAGYAEEMSLNNIDGRTVLYYNYNVCTFYTNSSSNYMKNYIDVPYNGTDPVMRIAKFFGTGDDTGFDYSNSDSEGCIDNPIYDEEIGTLVISKSKMYEESNGEDVNDLYNLFSWKMKTNTGFSLSDNKYARTFIQVRVESKCVVYDDRRHTKIHKNFDNYGEKAMLINSHPADSQPLKISYLTDIPNVLPKTHAEIHNPVYAGYNYTLYFRVVCTDDLAVIPSDTSEWHCGGWRALDCNADILVGQSDTTENGSFDDSDNWVPDEDDGNNSIEAGSDSVHDTDDAKDDFNNSSSAVDSSVNGAISTMQSLLDMIRHVPQIISTIFSFLPSWCLNIVGLAFVALVVLIIYKLVRG